MAKSSKFTKHTVTTSDFVQKRLCAFGNHVYISLIFKRNPKHAVFVILCRYTRQSETLSLPRHNETNNAYF